MKPFYAPIIALLLACLLPALAAAQAPVDNSSAVILTYYRIDENGLPASNLRREQFRDHITEIVNGDYTVLPVPDIIDTVKRRQALSPNTLGITFQGGFKSILKDAVPLLLKHNIPFTVFFSTDLADADTPQHLNWKDLKTLARYKNVTLGIMPAGYSSITAHNAAENKRLLNKAVVEYRKHFKSMPDYFAYPYGEYDEDYKKLVKSHGFKAAFGLQSGAVFPGQDMLALPRFSMTENYGDLERFKLVARTRPFPAEDIHPRTSLVKTPFSGVGFTLPPAMTSQIPTLRCYASGQGQIPLEILGTARVEIRPNLLPGERLRINCTAPISTGDRENPTAYRWLGFLLAGRNNS